MEGRGVYTPHTHVIITSDVAASVQCGCMPVSNQTTSLAVASLCLPVGAPSSHKTTQSVSACAKGGLDTAAAPFCVRWERYTWHACSQRHQRQKQPNSTPSLPLRSRLDSFVHSEASLGPHPPSHVAS
jgi:hypothetical protein